MTTDQPAMRGPYPSPVPGVCGRCGGTGMVHGPGRNGNWTDERCDCEDPIREDGACCDKHGTGCTVGVDTLCCWNCPDEDVPLVGSRERAAYERGKAEALPLCQLAFERGKAEGIAEREQAIADALIEVDHHLGALAYIDRGGVPYVEREWAFDVVNKAAKQLFGDGWARVLAGAVNRRRGVPVPSVNAELSDAAEPALPPLTMDGQVRVAWVPQLPDPVLDPAEQPEPAPVDWTVLGGPKDGYCCPDSYASHNRPEVLHSGNCPGRCRVPVPTQRSTGVPAYPCALTIGHDGDHWLHPSYRAEQPEGSDG